MANTKISQLTALTTPTGSEEFVYAYNNANGKVTLNTVKSFVGGAGITTLSADANIWELSEGTYVTTYALYYKSGEKVPTIGATGSTFKQMIFVVKESTGETGYLAFSMGHKDVLNYETASFGYSVSSSVGNCDRLGSREWALKQYTPLSITGSFDSFNAASLTQIVDNMNNTGTNDLRMSSLGDAYAGVTYTIVINSVSSAYDVTLGTGVTNPLGITLPTSSSKKCVITVLATSTTTGIVTSCVMEP